MPKRSKTRSRGQQGGSANTLSDSGWGYGLETAGGGWDQFMNTLSFKNTSPSNELILKNTSRSGVNVNANARTMKGGSRRRRSRRGGNLIPVLNQAAVPLALLAMNQYAKRRTSKKHSFRRRSIRRRR